MKQALFLNVRIFLVVLLTMSSFLLSACLDDNMKDEGRDDQSWNDPKSYNSDHFDLSRWKITLPIKGEKGKAMEVKDLTKLENRYFYDAPDGGMVFMAPVNGPTTKGSKYPRSELREMDGKDEAAWQIATGGTMSATLKVDEVPTREDGKPARVVIGQIHGKENELIRLYWEGDTVYFNNDLSGEKNDEESFYFKDENGQSPRLKLGEKFGYIIDAHGDTLHVTLKARGRTYTASSPINPIWKDDIFYFKAGVYLGANKKQGATGRGAVTFYGLDYSHQPGQGLKGLKL